VIIQGLNANPNAVCFALLYGDRSKYPDAVACAHRQANLKLLAVDGAILNTIERDWRCDQNEDHPFHGSAVAVDAPTGRTESPANRCKFMLGDFKEFGEFLAQQLQPRPIDGEFSHGK
jgi:hypothetical protein